MLHAFSCLYAEDFTKQEYKTLLRLHLEHDWSLTTKAAHDNALANSESPGEAATLSICVK